MLASELYHHGILGQRWGIRRFQNADGTLTEEGRKRYGEDGIVTEITSKTDISQKIRENQEVEDANKQVEQQRLESKKQQILASRSAAELYKNADLFTTAELQSAYTRLSLEKSIANLVPADISKGQQFVTSAIKTTKQISDLSSNTISLYNNIAKVYNTFLDGDLPTIKSNNNKQDSKKEEKK